MKKVKGILLAGGRGTRLAPVSTVINKHLLPIYDKPMFYYPLSTLMLSGIREIALISDPKELNNFQKLLGDGSRLGIEITYFAQEEPNGLPEAFTITEKYLNGNVSALILGDNLLFGPGYGRSLQNKNISKGASIFAYPVDNPRNYGVIELNHNGEVVSLDEKPLNPKSNLAIPGFYFFDGQVCDFARGLKPSKRGELEIIDLLRIYQELGQLEVEVANRGTSWLDAGTTENLFTASELVKVTQNRQGYKVNVPEEIAFESGWITLAELNKTAQFYKNSPYGEYLFSVAHRANSGSV